MTAEYVARVLWRATEDRQGKGEGEAGEEGEEYRGKGRGRQEEREGEAGEEKERMLSHKSFQVTIIMLISLHSRLESKGHLSPDEQGDSVSVMHLRG